MSSEQGYSNGRLFIDEESFPVKKFTIRVETVGANLSDGRVYELQQLAKFTFTCEADLEWLPPLYNPLCNIEFHYTTLKRRLFIDVPLRNCLVLRGTKEVGGETSAEVTFQGGEWALEREEFTWKKWWRALCAKFKGQHSRGKA